MIEQLFPPGSGVASAEVFGTTEELLPLVDELFPSELATLSRSVDSRRADYAAARWCARQALASLGLPPVPILNRPDRSPIWPDGVVGSLTHTAGYAAAVVAPASLYSGIGIDAEPDLPLPEGVGERVLTDADRDMIAALPTGGPNWDRLVFCIKEATYKVWQPIMGTWLGFEDANVQIHPGGTCRTSLVFEPLVYAELRTETLVGRWRTEEATFGCEIGLECA